MWCPTIATRYDGGHHVRQGAFSNGTLTLNRDIGDIQIEGFSSNPKSIYLNFLPKVYGGPNLYSDTDLPMTTITPEGTSAFGRYGNYSPSEDNFSKTESIVGGGYVRYTGVVSSGNETPNVGSTGTYGEYTATPSDILRFFAGGASLSDFPNGVYRFTLYNYCQNNAHTALGRPCDSPTYTSGRTFSITISDGYASSTGENIQVINPIYGAIELCVSEFIYTAI